ncbi:MAG: hypothetical protein WKG01_40430 [Kofleriaceae bacterium]
MSKGAHPTPQASVLALCEERARRSQHGTSAAPANEGKGEAVA